MKKTFSFILIASIIFSMLFVPASAVYEIDGDDVSSTSLNHDGYIVKLTDNAQLLDDGEVEEIVEGSGLYLADDAKEVIALCESGTVEYFEPNYIFTLADTPNDTFYSDQWNLEAINANSAREAGITGKGVRVAVIDSGINASHEDFAGTTIATGYNTFDGTTDVTDGLGHGTRVASIIAATTNNATGIAGIASGAVLVPIKCFSDSKETSASYIVKGMYAAVDDLNCSVINLSLGIEVDMAAFKTSIDHAVSKGAIIVAAVGNSGTDTLLYPAAYSNVIGVGSISKSGTVSTFSNHNSSVFVTAPGEKILCLGIKSNTTYSSGSGTSFAAPHVTAMAVLARCYNSSITFDQFASLLAGSSTDKGDSGYDTSYGYGVINIAAFIEQMETDYPATTPFSDIISHWSREAVEYVYENGLFNGSTATLFNPDGVMNRAMAVTVLQRLSGNSSTTFTALFTDVAEKDWYSSAVTWGASTDIVRGNGNGTFSPLSSVTREQMASFLYRYAVTYGYTDGTANTSVLSTFADGASVSSWAQAEMAWAVENGLFSGRSGNKLDPSSTISRAEVATVIMRFAESLK